MINRKDDYAIFLILSCHQCPLCVCASGSMAKGQIRASLGRENTPQNLSFDTLHPLYTAVRLSTRFLWDQLWVSFQVDKCTDKNLSAFFGVPCVWSASGQKKPK